MSLMGSLPGSGQGRSLASSLDARDGAAGLMPTWAEAGDSARVKVGIWHGVDLSLISAMGLRGDVHVASLDS